MMASTTDPSVAVILVRTGYAKVDSATEEIRLARVAGLPAAKDAVVVLDMTTVSLEDSPEYDAPSNARGTPGPTSVANINGHSLPIAQNLLSELLVSSLYPRPPSPSSKRCKGMSVPSF